MAMTTVARQRFPWQAAYDALRRSEVSPERAAWIDDVASSWGRIGWEGPPESFAGLGDLSRAELYERAKAGHVDGRSKMTRAELIAALADRS